MGLELIHGRKYRECTSESSQRAVWELGTHSVLTDSYPLEGPNSHVFLAIDGHREPQAKAGQPVQQC